MNRVHPRVGPGAFLVLTLWAVAAGTATAENLTCSTAPTLDALATCVRSHMPPSGSHGFVAPTPQEQSEWRNVVRQMLKGACSFALPARLAGIMQLRTFNDAGNGRNYCLLIEVLDADDDSFVDRGWGTFIVFKDATLEVHHHAPHPIADSTTENQAIGVFRATDSRAFLMAGAHRDANSGYSLCQRSYGPADAAHNVANMFQPTTQALMAFYGSKQFWVIQWHGMAANTCPLAEVYLSHGRDVKPAATDKIYMLQQNMLKSHPTWDIEVTGSGACSLNATDNTQGRLLNGVPAGRVCDYSTAGYSGRFLHIEQDPGFRAPDDWAQAVIEAFPRNPTAPDAPAEVTATAGSRRIAVSWRASTGATSYRVKRSTRDGGPYTVIRTVSGMSFTNLGLRRGRTYYYVVSARGAAGESPNSTQVIATAK